MDTPYEKEINKITDCVRKTACDQGLSIEERSTSSPYPTLTIRYNKTPIAEFSVRIWMTNDSSEIGEIEMSALSGRNGKLKLSEIDAGSFKWTTDSGCTVLNEIQNFVSQAKQYVQSM
jgi:hypothetical protein